MSEPEEKISQKIDKNENLFLIIFIFLYFLLFKTDELDLKQKPFFMMKIESYLEVHHQTSPSNETGQ